MVSSILKIDVSMHKSPLSLIRKLRKNHPDSNVTLSLKRGCVLVEIKDAVPTQLKLDIFSFVTRKINEEIYA